MGSIKLNRPVMFCDYCSVPVVAGFISEPDGSYKAACPTCWIAQGGPDISHLPLYSPEETDECH